MIGLDQVTICSLAPREDSQPKLKFQVGPDQFKIGLSWVLMYIFRPKLILQIQNNFYCIEHGMS